jgi:putative ABC transport system substrate-binding protein
VTQALVREADALEAPMAEWGREPHFGVVVPPDPFINSLRARIIALAARYRLPVIYGLRAAAAEGGLASYGVDIPNLFRQAATYADRILKGEKPADLPVQLPTKFEFVINRKSANMLGLAIPERLLATADEVIE